MDRQTLDTYRLGATGYCEEWLSQPVPADMQDLWRRYFVLGQSTADIGAGSGRDVDWLNREGYPCVGFDASDALIREAQRRFPRWRFMRGTLPELAEVPDGAYANVVCETVLMHLPVNEIRAATRSLIRILRPFGTLYLSWRVTAGADGRDSAGRLYSAFPVELVRAELGPSQSLYDSEETSQSSGRRVHRLVVRRNDIATV
jgi:SAM-dependent methyltransferase